MLEAECDETVAIGDGMLDRRGERGRILGVGPQGGDTARLVEGLVRRSDDGRSARHRLDDRDPEALEPRRVRDDRRSAIQTGELGVRDVPEPVDARPVEERLLAPALRSDDGEPEIAPKERLRLDQHLEVLPRLERRDREDVRCTEIRRRPVGREHGLRRRMRDADPLGRDTERRTDVAAR